MRKKCKIILSILFFICLVSVVIYVFYQFFISNELNDENIDKIITNEIENNYIEEVEYQGTITECAENEYKAYLYQYSVNNNVFFGCTYFKKNKLFKNRYEKCNGIFEFTNGEYVYSCNTENQKNIIMVAGVNLIDQAEKYSLEFMEEDIEIIGTIKDNCFFKIFILDSLNGENINCNLTILDKYYNNVKKSE